MEALIRSSNSKMIFFGKTLSPPRTLLGRSGFHFLRSPNSFNNVSFLRCISLQHNAIQFDSPFTHQAHQSEAWTGLESGSSGMQGSQPLKTVHVRFQIQKECSFGEKFLLVGDQPMIGSWDPSRGMAMNWSDGHLWTIEMHMPVDLPVQFKFVLQQNDEELLWQPGPDRILRTWDTKKTVVVEEDWENAELQKIMEEDAMNMMAMSGADQEATMSMVASETMAGAQEMTSTTEVDA